MKHYAGLRPRQERVYQEEYIQDTREHLWPGGSGNLRCRWPKDDRIHHGRQQASEGELTLLLLRCQLYKTFLSKVPTMKGLSELQRKRHFKINIVRQNSSWKSEVFNLKGLPVWSILIYRLNNWETGKENVRFLCILQIQLVHKSKLGIITGQLDNCGNLDAFFKRWFVTGWAE